MGAVPVDLHHHALFVLELEDGILQLLVEHAPVGDDDDRVEHGPVVVAMQGGEAVRQPGNAVALATAGGVLDEVGAARSVPPGVGLDRPHHVELVVAREDHALRPDRLAVRLALALPQMHEPGQDVQQAIVLPDIFPQVGRAVAARVVRIARARAPPLVERQEGRVLPRQARGHVDLVGVDGEVDQRALLERQQQVARVAVAAVLRHGVPHRLAGQRVLEFGRGHGQPVDEERQIEFGGVDIAVAQLPRDRQSILAVQLHRLGGQTAGGPGIGQLDSHAVVGDAAPQHVERSPRVQLFGQPRQELDLDRGAVDNGQPGPLVRLRVPHEGARSMASLGS